MRLNEFCTLHKHTAGAAATIVNAAVIKGPQNGDQDFDYTGRRIKFPTANALFFRKLSNAVFIGAAQKILASLGTAHIHAVRKNIDHIAQYPFIQIGAGIVFGQHIL